MKHIDNTTHTMKKISTLLLASLLLTGAAFAADTGTADQRWATAVEKMIVGGAATISAPNETRVQIAKELATKHGRKTEVVKLESGYRVTVKAAEVAGK